MQKCPEFYDNTDWSTSIILSFWPLTIPLTDLPSLLKHCVQTYMEYIDTTVEKYLFPTTLILKSITSLLASVYQSAVFK